MSTYLTLTALAALRRAYARSGGSHPRARPWLGLHPHQEPGKLWVLMMIPGIVAGLPPWLANRRPMFWRAAIAALVLTRSGLMVLGYNVQLDYDMPWKGVASIFRIRELAPALLAPWRLRCSPGVTCVAGTGPAHDHHCRGIASDVWVRVHEARTGSRTSRRSIARRCTSRR